MLLFGAILLWTLTAWAETPEAVGYRIRLSDTVASDEAYQGIRLRGVLGLLGNPALAELSGLAWDQDEGLLYAVSDRGRLLHLRPVFSNGLLTGLTLERDYPLLGSSGKPLTGKWNDAEGLTLENARNGTSGDSQLLISFEINNRIVRYRPDGHPLGPVSLPGVLTNPRFYKDANNGLESLTLHPTLGLLTGPEKSRRGDTIPFFDPSGERWLYRPFEEYGAMVALEALDNGEVIVLERAFSFPLAPWTITLARVRPSRENAGTELPAERLARFNSGQGWRISNFEGLTHHRDNRFFMVSDDGGKVLLQTQLVYFEIL
jgi:hypothetical protein